MTSIERFSLGIDEVYYHKFSCGSCGEFLFNSGDPLCYSCLLSHVFIFVDNDVVKNRITICGTNIVRCQFCYAGLGGMVYRNWTIGNHLVRFVEHTLHSSPILLWNR